VELICEEMGEVVEGVPTAKEVILLAERLKLDLPLFTACAKVIQNNEQTANADNATQYY